MDFVAINKLSLLDYPNKVSCILFTRGCNFRCPFCHNGLTLLENKEDFIPFEDIISFLKKRVGVLDGVVISGGEPTLMPDLEEKIRAIKALGYDVKLDTNGSNPDILKHLVNEKLIDYVAMDVKGSLAKYREIAGAANLNLDRVVESIEFLKSGVVDYEFRTTTVDEFHNEVDMISMGRLLKGAKRLYLQKFQISEGVINKNLHPVDEDSIHKFVDILKEYVDEVDIRGY